MAKILSGNYNEQFVYLYKIGIDDQKQRYCAAIERFETLFGTGRDLWILSAPGRTELSGNHTDHQHGRVLAAAVTLDTLAVVSPRSDMTVDLRSDGFRPCQLDLSDLSAHAFEEGSSVALVRGIAADLKNHQFKIGGFDAYTISQVPAGSGLSSSAAFETLVGNIFNHLYNHGQIDAIQIARTGQYAENIYFGKPCGLMDQTASSCGNVITIDFADPAQPEVSRIDFDFKAYGYSLYVVNAGGSHAGLTDEYAAIPAEMKEVAAFFNRAVLRDVGRDAFYSQLPDLRKSLSDRAILRAMHFFEENERVDRQVDALRKRDIAGYLRLMQESGDSSAMKLQNIYPTPNTRERSVLLALAICQQLLAGHGAWRVHGGGFAGTVQALVPNEASPSFQKEVERIFGRGTCTELFVRAAGGCCFIAGDEVARA